MWWYVVTLDAGIEVAMGAFATQDEGVDQQTTFLAATGNIDQGVVVKNTNKNFPRTLKHQVARHVIQDVERVVYSDGSWAVL